MENRTLMDITGDFLALYDMATEDEEVFKDTLESLDFDLAVKGRGYVQVMKQLEMEADKADEIAKGFAEKARVRRANIKRIKDRMAFAMDAIGKKKIEAGEYTISLKGNGGLQPLVIDGEVPDSMKKVVLENDNQKIREYLKENTCTWAHLEERGKHIEVK